MPFKSSNCCKLVFDHLSLSFNAVNTVLMYKIDVKFKYAGKAVCTYAHNFRNRIGCALIGACALIRMNMVHVYQVKLALSYLYRVNIISEPMLKIDT